MRLIFVKLKWILLVTSVTSIVEQLITDSAVTSCILADTGTR